ncbi:uncharacterized protein L969DRAFT_222665 [Mixia osmundae IAM 14324]|uniref:uncharacterized protein n=1 Tax=Mixia osmundae (strain CBS 9802 / IAM 14324 / JCM 22182 / KY 12970) TaxID=764103 RepID=UPI0004A54D1B|nr:uncharacterized protein L969DRAFT_222665 [Mixia osmundae IAM 14324]KEI37218.1 hypothetical protein L969DRAFT_222665 [Mixia osmundae IAM 14324]
MLEAIFGILLLLLSAIVPALCQDGHLLGIDPDIADEFIMPYYKIETKVVAECAGRTTTITPAFFEVVTISKAKQQLTQKPFNY